MAEIQELIDRLKDFRTRADAKAKLLELGEKAVPPLVEALKSRNAGVRWAAINILGELRATDAVPALIEQLKDPQVSTTAAESLQQVTGQQFGEDYDAWSTWHSQGRDASGPAVHEMADADLVGQATYNTDVSAAERPPGYILRVAIGDRHQDVMVNFKAVDYDRTPLVVIFTRIGPADPKLYDWALRQNVRMSCGAIALADMDGKPTFILVDAIKRASITPQRLIDAVKRIAREGDKLEAGLMKADHY